MEVKPASSLPVSELATLFNTAFAGYNGRGMNFTPESLTAWMSKHFIAPERGYIFYDAEATTPDQPVGLVLVAEREDKAGRPRLVTMGTVTRRQGHGYKALVKTIEEERKKGTEELELECFLSNHPALALYKKCGFSIHRELPCWETDVITEYEDDEHLEEVSVDEVQRVVKEFGDNDIPWQAWDFASQLDFAKLGFKLDQAYCVIGNPEESRKEAASTAKTIKMATLFVLPDHRKQGQGTKLVKAVMGRFKGYKWYAAGYFPLEYGEGIGRAVGGNEFAERVAQMRLRL